MSRYKRTYSFATGTRAKGTEVKDEFDSVETYAGQLPTPDDVWGSKFEFADASGTDSLTVNAPKTWTTYTGKDGYKIRFRAANKNTGSVTLNVDGLGAKPVIRNNGNALVGGDINPGASYRVTFHESQGKFYIDSYDGVVDEAAAAAKPYADDAKQYRDTAKQHRDDAETHKNDAATSASNAASSYDSFDDRYLGAKASDPGTDNDGDPLVDGALYFNTSEPAMKVWNGSKWIDAYNKTGTSTVTTNGSASGTVTIDFTSAQVWELTLSGATTIDFGSLPSSERIAGKVIVSNLGNHSVTVNNTKIAGGFPSFDGAYSTHYTAYENNSFDVSGQTTNIRDVSFADGGSKMYALDSNATVHQYTLGTAHDTTGTVTHDGSFDASTEITGTAGGLSVRDDGSKLYVCDETNDNVAQYSLGTNYDVTGTVTHEKTLNVGSNTTSPTGIEFSNDETVMFLSEEGAGDVQQYSLGTAGDLTGTVTHDGTLSISGVTSLRGLDLNDDGTKIFCLTGSAKLFEIIVDSAFDITGVTTVNEETDIDVVVQDGSMEGIAFNGDGSSYFIAGDGDDDIHQFSSGHQITVLECVQNDSTVLASWSKYR